MFKKSLFVAADNESETKWCTTQPGLRRSIQENTSWYVTRVAIEVSLLVFIDLYTSYVGIFVPDDMQDEAYVDTPLRLAAFGFNISAVSTYRQA